MTRWILVCAAALVAVPLCAQQPSAAEVAFIYELNRARSDPQAYDTENSLGGILTGTAAQPPLAVNLDLCESARVHAEDMAATGYFAHTSPTLGQPNGMAINAGYPLPYPAAGNSIESLAVLYSTGGSISYAGPAALEALIIDAGVNPPGHRIHLLATNSFFQTHREIGTGYAQGLAPVSGYNSGAYWAIHTAERTGGDPVWITGVVYNDTNTNGRYDLGEGTSGVTVTATGSSTLNATTNAGGGYSIAASAGAWTVTANGGSFSGTSTANITLATANVAVDFESGTPAGEVGFGNQIPGSPGGGGGGGGDDKGGGGGCAAEDSGSMLWLLLALVAIAGIRVCGYAKTVALSACAIPRQR